MMTTLDCRQSTHKGHESYRIQITRILDANPERKYSPIELAEEVGCKVPTARRYYEEWNGIQIHDQKECQDDKHSLSAASQLYQEQRCVSCGFPAWRENPILTNGHCLWCVAQEQKIDLRTLIREMGWLNILTALKDMELLPSSFPMETT